MSLPRAGVRVGIIIALLVSLSVAMELTLDYEATQRTLRDGFGPEGSGSSRSMRLLEQLDMPSTSIAWAGLASEAPSSRAVSSSFLKPGQWLVSLAIPNESLHDPERGILTHLEGRGREWERVGWLSLYDGRRLVLATQVGVRVHGGSSRGTREAFRVIFRPSYGLPSLPSDGPLATGTRPADRFVIRRSQVRAQVQTIAFEIARRIGAVAPSARSVRFVMNGTLRRQAYELSESVSPEGWGRSFFRDEQFRFYQFRGSSTPADAQAYNALRDWVRGAPFPLLLEDAAGHVDPELFVRHILTIMYCGTSDWAQGAAVLDLRSPRPRWFWVHWDLDQSFWDPRPDPWRQASVALVANPARPNERVDVRAQLFVRLVREDPAFADYFTRILADTLNHRLTQDYLQDLYRRHRSFAVGETFFLGFDLSRFFEGRGDQLFDAVADAVRRPRPFYVGVDAPAGVRLEIDGYEHDPPYLGRYFRGQTVRVRVVDGAAARRWAVNGRERTAGVLDVVVDAETLIELKQEIEADSASSPAARTTS